MLNMIINYGEIVTGNWWARHDEVEVNCGTKMAERSPDTVVVIRDVADEMARKTLAEWNRCRRDGTYLQLTSAPRKTQTNKREKVRKRAKIHVSWRNMTSTMLFCPRKTIGSLLNSTLLFRNKNSVSLRSSSIELLFCLFTIKKNTRCLPVKSELIFF